MSKVITVKVNKGGVGKTFISTQLAHGLALTDHKVLILTSDSQNNVLDYTFPDDKKPTFEKGFVEYVKTGNGDLIRLRENMYFMPLEDSMFSNRFLEKLPSVIEGLKKEYDYIIIDSIPTMKIDTTFVECSDHIIIPCFCDRTTVNGAINVIDEAGAEKVLAIIVNKFKKTATQKKMYNELFEAVNGTPILFPEPISELSQVEKLLEKGKTIFETNTKSMLKVQDTIIKILEGLKEI